MIIMAGGSLRVNRKEECLLPGKTLGSVYTLALGLTRIIEMTCRNSG